MNSDVESGSMLRLNSKPTLWFDVLFGLLPLLMVAPQLSAEFQLLWSSRSTRYFGLPIILVFGWVACHWRSSRTVALARIGFSRMIFVLALLLFGLSVWQFSPWLTHVSYVVFFTSWALERFGSVVWPRVFAWAMLLATSVRLAGGWSVEVQAWVVRSSASLLGNILDGLGIPFLIQADNFNMLKLQFSMSECCDGVFSVYALTSLVVLMLIVSRRSLLVAVISVLSVPLWAIVQNVLLLLFIVLLRHHTERDASQGVDHGLIQLVVFLIVAVSCWISVWFISRLLQPVPAADSQFEPEFLLLNSLLCWPQPDPFSHNVRRPTVEVATGSSASPKWSYHRAIEQVSWVAPIVLVALGGFTTTRRSNGQAASAALPAFNQVDLDKYAWKDTFPPTFNRWRQLETSYRHTTERGIKRLVIDWQFDWLGQILQLQITFPYNQRPRFADRYITQGWQVLGEEPRRYVPKPSANSDLARETAATLTKPVAQYVARPQSWTELRIANELGGRATALVTYHRIDGQFDSGGTELPPSLEYQVVLFCESGQELTQPQLENLNRGFQSADERLQRLIEPQLRELLGGKP